MRSSGRILIVDDDVIVARFLAADLALEGYEVEVLVDPGRTLERAVEIAPDLVLLDIAMAGTDGIEVLRRLRAHPPTASLPVIVLTAKADATDKVLGLTAGADDYVVKPFDTLELVARIRGTLRRTADSRALSPLTGLSGNHRIEVEIATRAAAGLPYAVCHVDLDEFKAFNDAYGFQRGDELLLLLAGCLQRAVLRAGDPAPFLGHIGGDDFVLVCAAVQAETICGQALAEFDAQVVTLYDAVDAERGWLEVLDRRGELRRHPFVSVSMGVATQRAGDHDPREVVAAAGEMKNVAKATPGSLVAVDRRG